MGHEEDLELLVSLGLPTDRKLTIEDREKLPDDGNRYEILDGELFVSAAPIPRHQLVSVNLVVLLHARLVKPGRGILLHTTDVVLGFHDVAEPDLLFIRTERRSIIGPKNIQGPPDLAVEILSPSSIRADRKKKLERYAHFGIASYWIVDPEADTLEAFRLSRKKYVLEVRAATPEIVRPNTFPGLEVPLAEVFPPPGDP